MPEWNMRSKDGPGCVTHHQSCLPEKDILILFYEAGGAMYKDGVKLTLAAALAELPKPEIKPKGKKK